MLWYTGNCSRVKWTGSGDYSKSSPKSKRWIISTLPSRCEPSPSRRVGPSLSKFRNGLSPDFEQKIWIYPTAGEFIRLPFFGRYEQTWPTSRKRHRLPLRHTSNPRVRAKRLGARTSTSPSCRKVLKMFATKLSKGTNVFNFPFHSHD